MFIEQLGRTAEGESADRVLGAGAPGGLRFWARDLFQAAARDCRSILNLGSWILSRWYACETGGKEYVARRQLVQLPARRKSRGLQKISGKNQAKGKGN